MRWVSHEVRYVPERTYTLSYGSPLWHIRNIQVVRFAERHGDEVLPEVLGGGKNEGRRLALRYLTIVNDGPSDGVPVLAGPLQTGRLHNSWRQIPEGFEQ